jgi:hypothetical protein
MFYYDRSWNYMTRDEFIKWDFKRRLSLKNLKKVNAIRMGMIRHTRKMKDDIPHFKELSNWLIKIPNGLRGFTQYKWMFEDRYWVCKKVDHPPLQNPYKWNKKDLLQDKLINELSETNVWYWLVSTWAGKSIIMWKIIDILDVKTLVVVTNITLLMQLKKDFFNFFWVNCRTISWSKTKQIWCYENIVIANVDSVIKLDREYLETFDCTLLDEVDIPLSSDNRLGFVWDISSNYLYWFTGTNKLNHIDPTVFSIYLWPKQELILKSFTPVINKILTNFSYFLDDMKEMHEMKRVLYFDEDRNNLIIKTILDNLWDKKWICFCEYIDHAKILQKDIEAKWIKTFLLIWEITKEEREKTKKELKEYKWPCLLIGNVRIIWRWFDLPELSIWFLTVAEKFTSNISQYAWRIIREFPWKKDVIWYDFVDSKCKFLNNQSKNRTTTYKKEFPWCKINLILNEEVEKVREIPFWSLA